MDFDFVSYINALELNQLRSCQTIINEVILNKLSLNNSKKSQFVNPEVSSVKNIDDFVDYHKDFIDVGEKKALCDEINLLNFDKDTDSNSIQNSFISSHAEPYIWGSSKGPIVNDAISFDKYPILKSVMERINTTFGCNMNSALVSYYRCGTVNIRKHEDNEKSVSQKEPICVVSLGANRRVEFYDKKNDSYNSAPVMKLAPKESSLYIMKQGCQENFKHKVPLDKRVKHSRISISFRCFLPESERELAVESSVATPHLTNVSSPLSSLHHNTPAPPNHPPISEEVSPIHTNQAHEVSSVHFQHLSVTKKLADNFSLLDSEQPPPPQPPPNTSGYVPFRNQDSYVRTTTYFGTTGVSSKPKSDEKLCLIFGTSITTGIDAQKMSRGSRTVVNCSYSGARIPDILKIAQDFFVEHPQSVDIVDKIIISVGTNEVKYFNSDKYDISKRYRAPLIDLVKSLKFMFPHSIITFQSVLPIRLFYKYTAISVLRFNQLLFEICRNYGCMYLDCFEEFLDQFHHDHNYNLYRDNFHLNEYGLSRLCRALKFIIYHSSFNPLLRYHYYPRYHNSR